MAARSRLPSSSITATTTSTTTTTTTATNEEILNVDTVKSSAAKPFLNGWRTCYQIAREEKLQSEEDHKIEACECKKRPGKKLAKSYELMRAKRR